MVEPCFNTFTKDQALTNLAVSQTAVLCNVTAGVIDAKKILINGKPINGGSGGCTQCECECKIISSPFIVNTDDGTVPETIDGKISFLGANGIYTTGNEGRILDITDLNNLTPFVVGDDAKFSSVGSAVTSNTTGEMILLKPFEDVSVIAFPVDKYYIKGFSNNLSIMRGTFSIPAGSSVVFENIVFTPSSTTTATPILAVSGSLTLINCVLNLTRTTVNAYNMIEMASTGTINAIGCQFNFVNGQTTNIQSMIRMGGTITSATLNNCIFNSFSDAAYSIYSQGGVGITPNITLNNCQFRGIVGQSAAEVAAQQGSLTINARNCSFDTVQVLMPSSTFWSCKFFTYNCRTTGTITFIGCNITSFSIPEMIGPTTVIWRDCNITTVQSFSGSNAEQPTLIIENCYIDSNISATPNITIRNSTITGEVVLRGNTVFNSSIIGSINGNNASGATPIITDCIISGTSLFRIINTLNCHRTTFNGQLTLGFSAAPSLIFQHCTFDSSITNVSINDDFGLIFFTHCTFRTPNAINVQVTAIANTLDQFYTQCSFYNTNTTSVEAISIDAANGSNYFITNCSFNGGVAQNDIVSDGTGPITHGANASRSLAPLGGTATYNILTPF